MRARPEPFRPEGASRARRLAPGTGRVQAGRTADPTEDAGWLLRAGRVADYQLDELDLEAAWSHTQLCGDVARQLRRVVPDGWEVSTGFLWSPTPHGDLLLRPDVVVHRTPEPDRGLPAAPTLCVTIGSRRLDLRSAQAYARFGVDHYWHLDSLSGQLEVLVRVDDDYRHAETLTLAPSSTGTDVHLETVEWVDFGIGIVRLTLGAEAVRHDVPSRVTPSPTAPSTAPTSSGGV